MEIRARFREYIAILRDQPWKWAVVVPFALIGGYQTLQQQFVPGLPVQIPVSPCYWFLVVLILLPLLILEGSFRRIRSLQRSHVDRQELIPAIERPEITWQSASGHLHPYPDRPASDGRHWERVLALWVALNVLEPPVDVETLVLQVQGHRIPPASGWEARRLVQDDGYTWSFLIPDDVAAGSQAVSVIVCGNNGREWKSTPLHVTFPSA